MGICIKSISEGCCDYLESLNPLKLDEYKQDKQMSSVDNVLECNEKYIFIEEKSFLLEYFRLAGKKVNEKLIPDENGLITDDFLETISKIENSDKKALFNKAVSDKLLSMTDKIKDTTFMLCKDDKFCDDKIKNAKTIYLYCKSSHPIDSLISIVFNSKNHKEKIISCSDLEKYLTKQGCI